MISTAIKAKREEKGWSKKYLADLIGVSSAAIGQYEKGDNKPKVEVLLKLNKVFDYDFINDKQPDHKVKKDIDLSQESNINHSAINKPLGNNLSEKAFSDVKDYTKRLSYDENSTLLNKSNNDEAPYLENVNASAGLNFLTNNGDATTYIKIPGAGVDAYINVFGDSMYPKYCAGEIIGVKEVQKEDLFFGHAFVIQMADGEAYIKYIQPGKDEDHWSLESENPKYPARQFHLSKISKIFKIKTTVTKNSL